MTNISKRLSGIVAVVLGILIIPGSIQAAVLPTPLAISSTNVTAGGTVTASGICDSAGTVSFALVRGGTSTAVGPGATTGAGGTFSSTLTIPSTYGSGSATVVATCNASGNTLVSPTISVAVPASASLTLGSTPALGGSVNVSGSCGSSATGTVTLALVRNGTSTNIGTATLGADGTFNTNVIIPASFGAGNATITATCGGTGATISSPVFTLAAPGVTLTISNSNPPVGGTITVSGTCPAGTTGNISYALVRNGVTTSVTAVSGTTAIGATGTFNNTITLPSGFTSGPATLVATCGTNGGTLTAVLNVGDDINPITFNTNPTVGGTVNVSGQCQTTLGSVGTTTISLVVNGVSTVLGTTALNADGTFNTTVTIPAITTPGPATLVATCGTTSSLVSYVILVDPGTTTPPTTTPGVILLPPAQAGRVGGVTIVDSSVYPLGGVDAGSGSTQRANLGLLLSLLGLVGAGTIAFARRINTEI
jgi:large repetitive protein